jgi:hypothetical protein
VPLEDMLIINDLTGAFHLCRNFLKKGSARPAFRPFCAKKGFGYRAKHNNLPDLITPKHGWQQETIEKRLKFYGKQPQNCLSE